MKGKVSGQVNMNENVKYKDEEIIKKRVDKKKQKYNSLEQGIYRKGKLVHFESYQVLHSFSIMLPEDWKQMPEEFARIKYPTEFRPQCILTSKELSVNMGFSMFPHELQINETKKMTERVMETIARENPGFQFFKFARIEKIKGYWFSFRSHSMDSDLFNQMLIAPVNGTIMMANFNCLYQEYTEWEQAVLLIWESIEELKEEADQR